MRELVERKQFTSADLAKINKDMEEVQAYLNGLRNRGRVSASAKVYPGVKILIRDVKDDVKTEYRAVTFVLENNLIRVTKYEEPDEDVKRGPDGYTSN